MDVMYVQGRSAVAERIRASHQGGRTVREEEVHYDIAVIGGGLAGTCAAIAAARLGQARRAGQQPARPGRQCQQRGPSLGLRRHRPRRAPLGPGDRHHGRAVHREPVPQSRRQPVLLGPGGPRRGPGRAEHRPVSQHRRTRGRGERPGRRTRGALLHRLDDGLRAAHHLPRAPVPRLHRRRPARPPRRLPATASAARPARSSASPGHPRRRTRRCSDRRSCSTPRTRAYR